MTTRLDHDGNTTLQNFFSTTATSSGKIVKTVQVNEFESDRTSMITIPNGGWKIYPNRTEDFKLYLSSPTGAPKYLGQVSFVSHGTTLKVIATMVYGYGLEAMTTASLPQSTYAVPQGYKSVSVEVPQGEHVTDVTTLLADQGLDPAKDLIVNIYAPLYHFTCNEVEEKIYEFDGALDLVANDTDAGPEVALSHSIFGDVSTSKVHPALHGIATKGAVLLKTNFLPTTDNVKLEITYWVRSVSFESTIKKVVESDEGLFASPALEKPVTPPRFTGPNMELKILDQRLINGAEGFALPDYATDGSAAIDLRACILEPLELEPGATATIPSGMAFWIRDPNIVGIAVPRSGLGSKHGVVLSNLTGVIDSDYQGEVKLIVWNRSATAFTIQPGERVCQLLFVPIIHPLFNIVDEFSETTERGQGGFGHTGRN